MKSIYIFSGLGADERVFKYLDLPGFELNHIKWIQPLINETMESYAGRIALQITKQRAVLIGLSFGGMMAIEVAKQIETEKIILIASAKTRKEIPAFYRIAGALKLNKLVPVNLLKYPNAISNQLFGALSKEDRKLLADIFKDTDPVFLKWAIDKIVNWKNTTVPENLFHIHGTADNILPHKLIVAAITIDGGGHLMTLNKPAEINQALMKLLKA